jgi:Bacterial Ig domain
MAVRGTDRRPARRFAAAAAIAAIGLLASACSSGAKAPSVSPSQSRAQASASASAHAAALAKDLKITPADGSHQVDPAAGITVTAVKGKVTNVTVTPSGSTSAGAVSGRLSNSGTSWRSDGNLAVSQSYTVTATGTAPSGEKITTTSTFKTLTPAATFSAHIFEGYKQSYGVGMPIILTFSHPITDKAAVERSLELTTSNPVVGAWYWDGDEQLYFRPRDYWPANTTVSFTGHFNGVQGARGVYGTRDLTQTFLIGRSLIAVASTTTHRTQIYLNGKMTYNRPTRSGWSAAARRAAPGTTTSWSTTRSGSPTAAATTTRPRGRSGTRASSTSVTGA